MRPGPGPYRAPRSGEAPLRQRARAVAMAAGVPPGPAAGYFDPAPSAAATFGRLTS
jgi:hypothetical protein